MYKYTLLTLFKNKPNLAIEDDISICTYNINVIIYTHSSYLANLNIYFSNFPLNIHNLERIS